jgi:heme a synthase
LHISNDVTLGTFVTLRIFEREVRSMSGLVLKPQATTTPGGSVDRPDPAIALSRFALGLAVTTLCLMALGSATRVMNAGLSCPDWPLCYGTLLPSRQMNLQVFLEWFHRLVAASMGFGVLTLAGASLKQRKQLPSWVPGAMAIAVGLILVQGLLGGLTVTELLRFDIVTAHLGTGLAFFCTMLAISLALRPRAVAQSPSSTGKLPWIGVISALVIYLQSLLGGIVASRWALHQCFGSMQLCSVMNRHIFGVFPAAAAVVVVALMVRRQRKLTPQMNPWLTRLSHTAVLLLVVQIALGVSTFRLHLQVEPLTVAHQMVGAMLLGSLVAFSAIAWRDRSNSQSLIKA